MPLNVVTGPPGAGKSTYVTAHARPGAVVIDFDRLAVALTAGEGDTHRHPRAVQRVAHRARRAAIREGVTQSQGRGCEVWIIHTQPTPEALADYLARGAQVITVDPGRDVVMQRCAESRSRAAAAAARRWYERADAPDADTSRAW